MELFVRMTGALVCGGSALRMPGSRKSKGEIVFDALRPPQPPASSVPAATRPKCKNLQLILTCRL
jgi:hypothetical protein